MSYRHACVVDAQGDYKTLVLVLTEQDEQGAQRDEIQYYTLGDGESLVDAAAPSTRPYAGAEGFVKPRWDGAGWTEGATAEEVATWEQEHPAPPAPEPTAVDVLGQQVAQLTLSNMQKDQIIDALGAQLAQTTLDVMALKTSAGGGV